jgi:hypothetical protein
MIWWWWGAALSALPSLRHAHILTLSFSLHVLSVSTYYRSDHSGGSYFLVISAFPVNPAFRSFRLSGRSSFLVVPAFRSFELSGRSSYSPSNRSGHCKQNKIHKEKRTLNYPPLVAYFERNLILICACGNGLFFKSDN